MDVKDPDDLENHPLADHFPVMTGEEFAGLKQDIEANGQVEPIVLFEDRILDGRNRHRACLELGIEPRLQEWSGPGSPLAYVIVRNLRRRHLDQGRLALLAARLMPVFESEARENRARGGKGQADLPPRNCRDRAAEVAGVSSRLVGSAATLLRNGTPALVAATDRAEVKVSAAAQVAALAKEEQDRLVGEGPAAVRHEAARLRKAAHDEARSRRVTDAAAADPGRDVRADPDAAWLGGFAIRGRLANPRIFDCRALAWRHLERVREEMRGAYPDVAAGEAGRLILFGPLPLWIQWLDPVPGPASWVVCTFCDGSGIDDERYCLSCMGDGFRTRDPASSDDSI